MKKKKNNELNKLELVLSGFYKEPWASRERFDVELEDHYGTYIVGKAQHFFIVWRFRCFFSQIFNS